MMVAGKAVEPFLLWVAEVREYKPHSSLHKITASYNAVVLLDLLADLYDISCILLSPTELGIPSSRSRHFAWGSLKEHFVTVTGLPTIFD